jgi:hypothetical protein
MPRARAAETEQKAISYQFTNSLAMNTFSSPFGCDSSGKETIHQRFPTACHSAQVE